MAYNPIQVTKLPDASKGWGLTPSVLSQNLSRQQNSKYGGKYAGVSPTTGVYENRMAEIKGNFATKQAQLDEAGRRQEADRLQNLNLQRQAETERANKTQEDFLSQKWGDEQAWKQKEWDDEQKRFDVERAWNEQQRQQGQEWKQREWDEEMRRYKSTQGGAGGTTGGTTGGGASRPTGGATPSRPATPYSDPYGTGGGRGDAREYQENIRAAKAAAIQRKIAALEQSYSLARSGEGPRSGYDPRGAWERQEMEKLQRELYDLG